MKNRNGTIDIASTFMLSFLLGTVRLFWATFRVLRGPEKLAGMERHAASAPHVPIARMATASQPRGLLPLAVVSRLDARSNRQGVPDPYARRGLAHLAGSFHFFPRDVIDRDVIRHVDGFAAIDCWLEFLLRDGFVGCLCELVVRSLDQPHFLCVAISVDYTLKDR